MKLSLPFADKLPRIRQREMPAIGAPVMVLATLAMVVLPIPAFLLDMFFTFNIALAMVVLLVTVYTTPPVRFRRVPDGTADRNVVAFGAERCVYSCRVTSRP